MLSTNLARGDFRTFSFGTFWKGHISRLPHPRNSQQRSVLNPLHCQFNEESSVRNGNYSKRKIKNQTIKRNFLTKPGECTQALHKQQHRKSQQKDIYFQINQHLITLDVMVAVVFSINIKCSNHYTRKNQRDHEIVQIIEYGQSMIYPSICHSSIKCLYRDGSIYYTPKQRKYRVCYTDWSQNIFLKHHFIPSKIKIIKKMGSHHHVGCKLTKSQSDLMKLHHEKNFHQFIQ